MNGPALPCPHAAATVSRLAHDFNDLREQRGAVYAADMIERGHSEATLETHGKAALRLAADMREVVENPAARMCCAAETFGQPETGSCAPAVRTQARQGFVADLVGSLRDLAMLAVFLGSLAALALGFGCAPAKAQEFASVFDAVGVWADKAEWSAGFLGAGLLLVWLMCKWDRV